MKHALRIAAHAAAPHPINVYPLASGQRLAASLRQAASMVPRTVARAPAPQQDAGFSPLVQDFLDECGYSDK